MKTLDEVIKALECCCTKGKTCSELGCPYTNNQCVDNGMEKDALHYLKKLQLFRETPVMQGIHKAQEEYATYPVEDWNPALTWDKLKAMEGKPVWVEEPSFFGNRWVIISGLNEEAVFGTSVGSQVFFTRDSQGDEWQAYRKERE